MRLLVLLLAVVLAAQNTPTRSDGLYAEIRTSNGLNVGG